MTGFNEYIATIDWPHLTQLGIKILLILAVAFILSKVIRHFLKRLEQHLIRRSQAEGEPPSESRKRIETIVMLVRQGIRLALWIVTGLIILTELGIAIGPIIASAGILGLAVGFGAQNLVRDVISGFFIILENQIRVGDVAMLNGTGGLVEKIHFRTTVLRDLGGVVHIFPNGTITTISNLTNGWSAYVFDIGVAYKENTDRVVDVIKSVCQDMRNDDVFGPSIIADAEIFGVDKLADSAVVIKGRIKTKPIKQWDVGREFLRRIKLAFDQQDIEIPFPHRSIYFGDASKPFDIRQLNQLQEELTKKHQPPTAE